MIASMWQSDFSLVLGAVLSLAATVVAIVRDTARRLKRSADPPEPAFTALGWPAGQRDMTARS